jgi:alanine racemase
MRPETENHWRSWCEIRLGALRKNLKFVRKLVGPEVAVMPMVKADAYGHGMMPVARVFEEEGADMIGCANALEGKSLREAGIKTPLLLLSGVVDDELKTILENDLTLTVSSLQEVDQVARAAERLGLSADVHIKVDTGMGRLGCAVEEAQPLMKKVMRASRLHLKGFYSHYACADEDAAFTRKQWKVFSGIASPEGVQRHICNSAGLLSLKSSYADMVRPGLVLFGASPLKRFQDSLQPALSWYARVVRVREVPKGTTISYGATFTASRRMKVATLSVGYGDGYFRALSNRGKVLIQGKLCRVLGRVTMDQIVVDVSSLERVRAGDRATLLGKEGRHEITAADLAQWAETIPYEIWCHITGRVVKIYHD